MRLQRFAAFTSLPVTFLTVVVYLSLLTALVVQQNTVPRAPTAENPKLGVNLTEAWRDLQNLSNGFHPYNSKRNDEIRDWLLGRIESILNTNKVKFDVAASSDIESDSSSTLEDKSLPIVIFNDLTSNVTFDGGARRSVYFEGSNIMVYIRGAEDEAGSWWNNGGKHARGREGKGGVLVNAHFDSVSTGFGSTDDGVGVITILQLLSHFSLRPPKRGLVLLLNNGEEDYLNGARAYTSHPISRFPRSVLNLEGAGAGGRATLFRSTSQEITNSYQLAPHPFGTVISDDGFQTGLVRSQTDYIVFVRDLNMQALDVAFMEPRAQYHTTDDRPADTSPDSLWHMLSAALPTVRDLTDSSRREFGPKFQGHRGVWFDFFGRSFFVSDITAMSAMTVSFFVLSILVLGTLTYYMIQSNRVYILKGHIEKEGSFKVSIDGWRGFFRFPVAFVLTTGAVIGLALLTAKVNPYIVYSSEYSVWSTILTGWFLVAWIWLRGADATRPSALTRFYGLIWIYAGAFITAFAVLILQTNSDIAGAYGAIFYFVGSFMALSIAMFELLGLPPIDAYIEARGGDLGEIPSRRLRRSSNAASSGRGLRPTSAIAPDDTIDDATDEANESTSLLRGGRRTTFATYGERRRSIESGSLLNQASEVSGLELPEPHGDEQNWSGSLRTWLWTLQFLLLAPFQIILLGQVGLILTSALHQTAADGSPVLTVYIVIASISSLILLPLKPFMHRISSSVPALFFFIFLGTLVYNLTAFPFSPNNKLKLYFLQEINLDSGLGNVSLTGLEPYVRTAAEQIPSTAGHTLDCASDPLRDGLTRCAWPGLSPKVVESFPPGVPPEKGYADWVHINATRDAHGRRNATLALYGRNTRACRLYFDSPVRDLRVDGGGLSEHYERVGENGTVELRLWSRVWEKPWVVHVEWDGDDDDDGDEKSRREMTIGGKGLNGRAACLWSDANERDVIPAFDEVRMFLPKWAIVSKLDDGLVKGYKAFTV